MGPRQLLVGRPDRAATADSAPQYQGLNEIQVFPAGPLATGYYEVILDGQAAGGSTALADPLGNPLGADAAHPEGQDITIPFQVDGIEGRTGAVAVEDDTPATAQQLGDLTDGGLVQVAGAIGDDPGPDTTGNPANQVDLYHFTVNGPGNASLVAEVFAGRIGSPLNPGISLFRVDPTDGTLVFVAGNIKSYNPATADDGSVPLYTDPVLYAGLTPGDYYLAVADASNTPSPQQGYNYSEGGTLAPEPGTYGLYDPRRAGQRPERLEHRPVRPQPARPARPLAASGRVDQPGRRLGAQPAADATGRHVQPTDGLRGNVLPDVPGHLAGHRLGHLHRGRRRDEIRTRASSPTTARPIRRRS